MLKVIHLIVVIFIKMINFVYNADSQGKVECHDKEGKEEFSLALSDIMMFATGSPTLPPLGLNPKPSLCFHSNGPLPTANTCTNVLHLPLALAMDPSRFFRNMCHAICNCQGFGRL